MLRRKLNEAENREYKRLVEEYEANDDTFGFPYSKAKDKNTKLYQLIFEDVKEVNKVYIDMRNYFNEDMHPGQFYDEVVLNDNSKHYVVFDDFKTPGKYEPIEYDLSKVPVEYFRYE